MRVTCCGRRVRRETFTHDDGVQKFKYHCRRCGLDLNVREARWEKLTGPVVSAGIDAAELALLVNANSRIR